MVAFVPTMKPLDKLAQYLSVFWMFVVEKDRRKYAKNKGFLQ